MKKPSIFTLGVTGVSVICGIVVIASVVSAANGIKDKNKIIADNTETPIDYIDETTLEEGLTSYTFEAENAEFKGKSSNGSSMLDHACAGASYYFSDGVSGGMALYNIFTSPAEKEKNQVTFTFNSDKNVTINMDIRISVCNSNVFTAFSFSDLYSIKVNKKLLGINDSISKYGDEYGMTSIRTPINIVAGENKIIFETKPYTHYTQAIFDCVTLNTTANITGYESHYWDLSSFEILLPPSLNRLGQVKRICNDGETPISFGTATLPDITTGVASGLYKEVDSEDESGNKVKQYFFSNSDVLVTSDPLPKIVQHKLTIVSDKVTFEDDTNEANVWEFYEMPSIKNKLDGYKIVGWYNVNNPSETWLAKEFAMPKYDVQIAPYFEVNEFLEEFAKGGKINLNDTSEGYKPIHSNGSNGFDVNGLRNKVSKTIIKDTNSFAEVATLYQYDKAPQEGWSFLTCNSAKINGADRMDLIYKLQNQGSDTLNLEIWQTNSSANPTATSNPHKSVTIKPNEIVSFELEVAGFGNINMMTYILFKNNCSSKLRLAMTQYSKKQSTLPTHNVTIQNVEGSNLKVKFANGTTSTKLKEEKTLPDLIVEGNENYELAGFINANDMTKYWTISQFVMGKEDVTLIPYFTYKNHYQVDLSYQAENNLIHPRGINGFTQKELFNNVKNSFVLMGDDDNKHYELATNFVWNGEVKTGYSFINMVSNKVAATYNIVYTFKNEGSETISFKIKQINVSADFTSTTAPSAEITLNPGESKVVTLRVPALSNANSLTYYEFLNDFSKGLKLATTQYFQVAK